MNWQALKTFLIAKSVERSTWLGLVTLASLLGYTIKPEYVEAIVMIGTGVGGMILLLTSDVRNVNATITMRVQTVDEKTGVVTSTKVEEHPLFV